MNTDQQRSNPCSSVFICGLRGDGTAPARGRRGNRFQPACRCRAPSAPTGRYFDPAGQSADDAARVSDRSSPRRHRRRSGRQLRSAATVGGADQGRSSAVLAQQGGDVRRRDARPRCGPVSAAIRAGAPSPGTRQVYHQPSPGALDGERRARRRRHGGTSERALPVAPAAARHFEQAGDDTASSARIDHRS
jgi:hypothetical protein